MEFKTRHSGFTAADYTVFALSIAMSLLIGFFYAVRNRHKNTRDEYHLGGKKMHMIPVAISLVVTFESSIFMMGTPAEIYYFGITYWFTSIGWLFTTVFGAFVYMPMLYRLNMTSAFEYLHLRYGRKYVRVFGSILQIIFYLLYMGIVLYAPALALTAITDFNTYAIIVVIACVAILYTAMGGLKAVVWTDFFQFLVMIGGLIAVIIKGSIEVGGGSEVYRLNKENNRFDVSFSFDPTLRLTFWSATFGTMARLCGGVFNQAIVQRAASLPNERAVITAGCFAAMWFVIFPTLAVLVGFVTFAYYQDQGCDLYVTKQISNVNQIIIFFVLEIFKDYPGLAGLFVASLFAASLSTLSSGLGSIAANLWEDILSYIIGPVTELKATVIAKITVIVAGFVTIVVSLLISFIGGTLVEITNVVLGIATAPLTALYILGSLFACANAPGAIVGSVFGMVSCGWLMLGMGLSKKIPKRIPLQPAPTNGCYVPDNTTTISPTTTLLSQTYSFTNVATTTLPLQTESESLGVDILYTLSPFVFIGIGIAVSVIVGVVASLLFRTCYDYEPVDERYIPPLFRPLWKNTRFMKKSSEYEDTQKHDADDANSMALKTRL